MKTFAWFQSCILIGLLFIALVCAKEARSAPPDPATPTNPATAIGSAVSASGAENASNKKGKETDDTSTPWGATVTAIASIIVSLIALIGAWSSDTRSRRIGRELEQLKFIHDLRSDYDKDLRNQRIQQYQKLLPSMVKLPKYPRPQPLTADEVRNLSLVFQKWYFDGGGLFLSENPDPEKFSECSRECYFDFQEGCKIILEKVEDEWKFKGDPDNAETNANLLREYLKRNPKWNAHAAIKELAACELTKSVQKLPEDVVEQLRRLASALRTSMTRDVLTREISVLNTASPKKEK